MSVISFKQSTVSRFRSTMSEASITVAPAAVNLDVSFDGKSHRCCIPGKLIQVINGQMFIQLSRSATATRYLMSLKIPDRNNQTFRLLSNSDVVDQLADARDTAIGKHVTGKPTKLSWALLRQKRYQRQLGDVPATMNITTPSIGGIDPISILMITPTTRVRGVAPVFVEVSNTALNWVMNVVAAQAMDGGVKSKTAVGRKRKCDIADQNDDDGDSVDGGGTQSIMATDGNDAAGDDGDHQPPVENESQLPNETTTCDSLEHL